MTKRSLDAPSHDTPDTARPLGSIVSSAHLAEGALPALSEVEFGLNMISHAYGRWMVRCMAAAGIPDLSALDVQVLHHVVHRDRPKTIADLCLVLDVEDTTSSLMPPRSCRRLALWPAAAAARKRPWPPPTWARKPAPAIARVREALLSTAVAATGIDPLKLSEIATVLRALSGHYDQAARSAASL